MQCKPALTESSAGPAASAGTLLDWSDVGMLSVASQTLPGGVLLLNVSRNGVPAWVGDAALQEVLSEGYRAHVQTRARAQLDWPIDELTLHWAGDTVEEAKLIAEELGRQLALHWRNPT